MNVNTLVRRGTRWWGFSARKIGYAAHAVAIILSLRRDELRERWEAGAKEHGPMSDAALREFPAAKNLRQEMQDGYWYHRIGHEQRKK